MADFGHPHVMILGQSFVHHLDQFIRRFQSSMKVKCNFNIQDKCQVSLLGIGGQTVGKIIQNDLGEIRAISPQIVVLEIGSNDLCDPIFTMTFHVDQILGLIHRLHDEFSANMWLYVKSLFEKMSHSKDTTRQC